MVKEFPMNILICTDGSPAAEQGAILVTRMGFPPEATYTLLGVIEAEEDRDYLSSSMERIVDILGGTRAGSRALIYSGHPVDQILVETQKNNYDLVVIGEHGHQRGLPLVKLGSTATKLARRIQAHLLVARTVPNKINKVLICTGAESPSVGTVRLGGELIAGLEAEIGLLHVMSQVFFNPERSSDDLLYTADIAITRGTREGQHLQEAIDQLRDADIKGQITPIIRHGLVVEEVLNEVHDGGYDLLVLGAHHKPGQNRWLGILLDDVADQLLNNAPCSVLII
jgi:nucleotide-binding universal stress UspA family protein